MQKVLTYSGFWTPNKKQVQDFESKLPPSDSRRLGSQSKQMFNNF